MKKFDNFSNFHDWLLKVQEETKKNAIKEVAEEAYKDCKKYIYLDTEEMYNSGATASNFDKGLVILRAPQVKWLYYTTWVKPRYNMEAVPQWWEAVKAENYKKYEKIYVKNFDKAKREV